MASSTVKTTESCDNKTTTSPDDTVDLEIKFEGTVLPSNDEAVEGVKQEVANDEEDKKDSTEVKKEKDATPAKGPRRKGGKKSSSASSKANLDERAKDPSPVALLDMLAEVASATLKNDPSILRTSPRKANKNAPGKPAIKILPKRSSQSEVLNLDQIRMLSDKLLLNMFAELTADEIRRNYTYICYLMPDKCQQEYTSFGNENRARMQMKTHLLGHIAELLSDANTAGRSQRGKFVAEPVPARKRRLATEHDTVKKRRFAKKMVNKSEKGKPAGKTTLAKPKVRFATTRSSGTAVGTGTGTGTASVDLEGYTKIREMKDGSSSMEVKPLNNSESKQSTDTTSDSQQTEIEGKSGYESCLEASVVADASYEQPFHDHCYTTTEGAQRSLEFFNDYDEDGDEDEEEEGEFFINEPEKTSEKEVVIEMTLQECAKSNSTGEEADDTTKESDGTATSIPKFIAERASTVLPTKSVTSSSQKETEAALRQLESVRLLQTKRSPRKQSLTETKMAEDEDPMQALTQDDESFEALDDEDDETDFGASGKIEKGSPEWERKLALKCIRLLRTKKKEERVALVCKICKDKVFTAQATLMYHYRSHAGIKPFVCNICNTTFTRQHSLNYHMLIHNNKSRFTCNDCGRKFRHPSHFKEHMRRHTGETPFECSDCGVRFKTRNTYKRHLKTRHGKLLTVNGIVTLSAEEFLKVKTNPKRRPRPRKDKETQWPEVSSVSFEVSKAVSLTARGQTAVVVERNTEDTAEAHLAEVVEEVEDSTQQKVVVRSANEYSITVAGDADTDAEPETSAVGIGTDPIEFGCTAEFAAAHLQSNENVALTFVECSRDGVSTLVALPIIKQESANDDEEAEWILPEMEVFPPSATTSLHPILRCM